MVYSIRDVLTVVSVCDAADKNVLRRLKAVQDVMTLLLLSQEHLMFVFGTECQSILI